MDLKSAIGEGLELVRGIEETCMRCLRGEMQCSIKLIYHLPFFHLTVHHPYYPMFCNN